MSTLPQLEEKIYSLVPELKYSMVNQWIEWHFPIEIKHWLPLLVGWSITAWWLLFRVKMWDWYERMEEVELTNIRYDFKKPLSEQSEELRAFLLENIKD